jgi:hypothetical protein
MKWLNLMYEDELFDRLKSEKELYEKNINEGKRVKWEDFIFKRCIKR